VRAITSRHNQIVGDYRDAARGRLDDAILLDGAHLVATALDAGLPLRHVMLAASSTDADVAALGDKAAALGVDVAAAAASVMSAVSPVRSSSGIVALAARPTSTASALTRDDDAFIIVAADVQDPGNLGAIARVAEAAGAAAMVTTAQSADPYGWKALRGSMGSLLRLPIVRCGTAAEAVDALRASGYRIVATTPRGGRPLFEAALDGRVAILVGGEGAGLEPSIVDAADERVTIPMAPAVESLNAAVAAALLAYEARRRRG
jgi:TrmH family RNA methyltransferase